MTVLAAVLAFAVALLYAIIALDVVPRLARLAGSSSPLLAAARWGAFAFFTGCALTHVQIGIQVLEDSDGMGAGPAGGLSGHMAVAHVLPHLAQVVGGLTVILIAQRHLDVRLATKDEAEQVAVLEQRFRAAFERSPIGIALVSADGQPARFLQVNPALCRMLGYDEGILLEMGPSDLTDPGQAPRPTGQPTLPEPDERELEQRFRHADGHDVWVQVRASRVRGTDGEALFDLTQLRDVTEQRRSEAQLRHFADHDPLTGVLNRRRVEQEVDRALSMAQRHLEPAAVMVVDLDQFKYINDTYGHAHGDALLRRVTRVLRSRLTDLLGRLGGDEFGVVCPHTTMAGARHLAEDLLSGVRQDGWVQVGERRVRMTMSIGVAVIDPATTLDREQLLAAADGAMYEAKESGRDRVTLVGTTTPPTSRMRERLSWSERIRDALESDGLVLWEQPLLDLRTGRRDRSELLVRMTDPDGGPPGLPGEFLPVAERFGQIQAIDRWVLGRAVELLASRRGGGRSLAVNLSATSLVDGSIVGHLAERLQASGVDPSTLTVEVTETAAISDLEVAGPVLRQIRELGCSLALDDFGSGFASFGYLKHLPFDCVKIDGDFVRDLPRSAVDRATVRAIVTMCRSRGITTVAEFVQDEQTLDLLREMGVDHAQGYVIAAPHPLLAEV